MTLYTNTSIERPDDGHAKTLRSLLSVSLSPVISLDREKPVNTYVLKGHLVISSIELC